MVDGFGAIFIILIFAMLPITLLMRVLWDMLYDPLLKFLETLNTKKILK